VPLFQRTPRGMQLLPDGAKFLVHARRILTEVAVALQSMRAQGADGVDARSSHEPRASDRIER
jgi:DNA-binding transcriptional LysR family regulator